MDNNEFNNYQPTQPDNTQNFDANNASVDNQQYNQPVQNYEQQYQAQQPVQNYEQQYQPQQPAQNYEQQYQPQQLAQNYNQQYQNTYSNSYGQQYQEPVNNYQQQNYAQTAYNPDYVQNRKENTGKGLGIASLVLGIVSVVTSFFCCGLFGIAPIVGLILGIVSKSQKKENNGMAIAGIILSAVALVIVVIYLIIYITTLSAVASYPSYSSFSYYY